MAHPIVSSTQAKSHESTKVVSGADEMICGCFNLTLGHFWQYLNSNPGVGFDEMMKVTHAGTKCTACLLDLEYHYVAFARENKYGAPETTGTRRGKLDTRRLIKRTIYRFIDQISPKIAYPFSNIMPVLTGTGIEEFVCVDNHSLLYDGKICAPDMRVELDIHDSEGRLRHHRVELVKRESSMRVNVSHYLDPPQENALGIGSVIIRRKASRPGLRGTTRPQIEITAAAGACALHGQAASRRHEGWLTSLNRPGEQKLFLSLLNASARTTRIDLAYPFMDGDSRSILPETYTILLPPHGAHLSEIQLPPDISKQLGQRPFFIRWRTRGAYKVHVICATPTLDRFSIDHL